MRVSREEIDAVLLDTAAGVFAQHGYGHTSVQQVADAVGYSKTGLLHRFGSKEAMYRAGLAAGEDLVETMLAEIGAIDLHDEDRTRKILRILTVQSLAHPGMSSMLFRAFEASSEGPHDDSIRTYGYRLLAALDPKFDTAADRLRVVLAVQMIVNAATAQSKEVAFDLAVPHDQVVPMVVEMSLQVLNVRERAEAGVS